MDLISVIVPVYKVEMYLDKCINSLINQTYKNLEIILIDDGSPDRSGEICDTWAQEDSRIKVIHKSNGGVASARNEGLKIATGKYFGFVDPDDYISENMFSVLYDNLIKNHADVSICAYNEVCGDSISRISICDKHVALSPEGAIRELIDDNTFKSYLWNKLYKAELFQGISFPSLSVMEDATVNYEIFSKSNKFILTNDALYNYVVRKGSITKQKNIKVSHDLYVFYSDLYDSLSHRFPDKLNILNSRKIASAFRLLVTIKMSNNANGYEDIYKDVFCFLKANRKKLKDTNLNANTKLKIRLFLLDYRIMFLVNSIYNFIKYKKFTPELL